MRTPAVRLAFVLLLLGLWAGGATPARAGPGTWVDLDPPDSHPDARNVRAWVFATPGSVRPGAYGWVTVRVENRGGESHRVDLSIEPRYGEGGRNVFDQLDVGPHGDVTVHLPLPTGQRDYRLRMQRHGTTRCKPTVDLTGGAGSESEFLSLLDTTRGRAHHTWEETFAGLRLPCASGTPPDLTQRRTADLPERWVLLTGFDLVLVDAADPGLTSENERVLVRYVAGGGRLIAVRMGPQTDRSLARLRDDPSAKKSGGEGEGVESGFHGLGRWMMLPGDDPGEVSGLEAWLEQDAQGITGSSTTYPFAGGVPQAFWFVLDVPGLGKVPVQAFFILILLFAVLVGPVSYVFFRRRRRLALLLVVIPLGGFLFAGAILLYGFFSEGFRIVGAVRSFSVLDQRRHEAVTCAARTLYAGLRPSALTPDAATFFSAPEVGDEHLVDASIRFDIHREAGGRVEGALPSRMPTAFTSASQGRARHRLRFTRREDGGFDVLAGPDFMPLEGVDTLVLRTHDGSYYVRTASGRLEPLFSPRSIRAIHRLVHPMAYMPLESLELWTARRPVHFMTWSSGPPVNRTNAGPFGFAKWVRGRFPSGLAPGTYLARMTKAPVFDDLGLDVDWRDAHHVVLGILAEDDILE